MPTGSTSVAGSMLIFIAIVTAPAAQPLPSGLARDQARDQAARPDRQFVMDAAVIGMAEVEFGTLALKRAETPAVKTFAQTIVSDHTAANNELKLIAAMNNVPWPVVLDPNHKGTLDALSALSGAAFDRAFMKQMLDGHQVAAAAFRAEIESGSDPAVKKWAEKNLSMIAEHLKMAEDAAKPTGN